MAALAKYHKLSGFETTETRSVLVGEAEAWDQGVDGALLSPRLLGEDPSCLSQLLVAGLVAV